AQALQWNTTWRKQCETEARIRRAYLSNEARRLHIESQKEAALEQTIDAQQLLKALRTLLTSGIELDPSLDWDKLKVTTPFPESIPLKPALPPEPQPRPTPPVPNKSSSEYQVN